MTEQWACEECGEFHTGEPAKKESYPGYEGRVELWFCENCITEPRCA